jgi:hypothetical protein
MTKTIPSLTLPAKQTRMINASEGFLLEVQSGCLWLTRPSDAVDRLLVAGSSMELHENQVLIQSDRHPGATGVEAARYRLTPIQAVTVVKQSTYPLPAKTQPLFQVQRALKHFAQFLSVRFNANSLTKKQLLT